MIVRLPASNVFGYLSEAAAGVQVPWGVQFMRIQMSFVSLFLLDLISGILAPFRNLDIVFSGESGWFAAFTLRCH